jgi:hypothetical protein
MATDRRPNNTLILWADSGLAEVDVFPEQLEQILKDPALDNSLRRLFLGAHKNISEDNSTTPVEEAGILRAS